MLRDAGPAATTASKPAAEETPAARPAVAATAAMIAAGLNQAADPRASVEASAAAPAAGSSAGIERQKAVRMSLMDMHLKQQQQAATIALGANTTNSSSVGAVSSNGRVTDRNSSHSPSGSTVCQSPMRNAQPEQPQVLLVSAVRCASPAGSVSPAASPRLSSSRPRSRTATVQATSPASNAAVRASSSRSPRSTAAAWAAADSATGAEVDAFLRGHWQQQHLPAAALVLQCAWRSRRPRLAFNR
jgi:hypothetical protein